MRIEKDKAVTLEYTLRNEEGEVLETSRGRQPLKYIHGAGLIKGFEAALEGRSAEESFSFKVKPEDGYGERRSDLVFQVPKEKLEGAPELSVGMPLQAQTPQGNVMVLFVSDIQDDHVLLDGNHPLAGMTLDFDVEVLEVRDATPEELLEARQHEHAGGCGSSCCSDTSGCGEGSCCS
ncbi:MAG: FKBP-type peptidyl-prolyl cis-trans isomerase SlyD [Syntrophorhabdaceae bacterium PtaU1.Bin034]|jgi:FKBP-type peptidyl-prolyl cis-trans isomerase SlyD|nr:MAG: FKBP-type peptidyl-prolyl cis-trans isomerase SlyD [Syntrophorhabdaceae bacterium PtaU1.Bin034]